MYNFRLFLRMTLLLCVAAFHILHAEISFESVNLGEIVRNWNVFTTSSTDGLQLPLGENGLLLLVCAVTGMQCGAWIGWYRQQQNKLRMELKSTPVSPFNFLLKKVSHKKHAKSARFNVAEKLNKSDIVKIFLERMCKGTNSNTVPNDEFVGLLHSKLPEKLISNVALQFPNVSDSNVPESKGPYEGPYMPQETAVVKINKFGRLHNLSRRQRKNRSKRPNIVV